MTSTPAADRFWLEQALALAALAEGRTAPNPRVGCLVVRDGEVVGRGYHHAAGEPHGEALALQEAGSRARGATLYVNLEPCAHVGRTPPCADQIVKFGIARVVASMTDPNPLVDGKGFARLRAAGIRVDVGLLERDAERLNAPFLHVHRLHRPRVTIKAGLSLDGGIAALEGRSRWITGGPARRAAHRLRFRHDAILVGAGTIRRDDPNLTVRLPGVRAPRLRAILAPTLDLDPAARVFQEPEDGGPLPRVYASRDVPDEASRRFEGRAEVVRVSGSGVSFDLGEVLADLASLGAQSVLVEGGGVTIAAFVAAGLADEAALFTAPILLGARGATPVLDARAAEDPASAVRLEEVRRVPLGSDLLLLACIGGRSCSRG